MTDLVHDDTKKKEIPPQSILLVFASYEVRHLVLHIFGLLSVYNLLNCAEGGDPPVLPTTHKCHQTAPIAVVPDLSDSIMTHKNTKGLF